MSYIYEKARLFKEKSQSSMQLASYLGLTLIDDAFYFFSKGYGLYSLAYPFYFIGKIIFSGLRLIYGSFLLLNALFISPIDAGSDILLGMGCELGSMVFNAINVALAIMSLFTKTFIGVFNNNNNTDREVEYENHKAMTMLIY